MEYFVDPILPHQFGSKNEADRIFDLTDEKWRHPLLRTGIDSRPFVEKNIKMIDQNLSDEERLEVGQKYVDDMAASAEGMQHTCEVTEYQVPGCPEEPETTATMHVYRPKGLEGKARVLFMPMGGGLISSEHTLFWADRLAEELECVVVCPKARCIWEAKYPAQINDVHASYLYVVEHAEELGVDPEQIVIAGCSSGAHLALCLGFRLKRCGDKLPRGIVAIGPQTDDREHGGLADHIYDGSWDAIYQHDSLMLMLGASFGSSRIGPEALANHATIEECVGYPPCFIHTVELDPDRDNCRELYHKMLEAKTYSEFHAWGGATHVSPWGSGSFMMTGLGDANEYSLRTKKVIYDEICDCWEYDLSRPWVIEE